MKTKTKIKMEMMEYQTSEYQIKYRILLTDQMIKMKKFQIHSQIKQSKKDPWEI